jgi:hypothetical protein
VGLNVVNEVTNQATNRATEGVAAGRYPPYGSHSMTGSPNTSSHFNSLGFSCRHWPRRTSGRMGDPARPRAVHTAPPESRMKPTRGIGARLEAPRRRAPPRLAENVVRGPHSWDEIQSPSQVQNEVPTEQLGRVRSRPGPSWRNHSLDLRRGDLILETSAKWFAWWPEEVLRSSD